MNDAKIREVVEIYKAARLRPLPRDSVLTKKLRKARRLTTDLRQILESLDLGDQLVVGQISDAADLRRRIGDAILGTPVDKGGKEGNASLNTLTLRLAKIFTNETGQKATHTVWHGHTPSDGDAPQDRYTSAFDRFVFDVCDQHQLKIGPRTLADSIGRARRVMKNVKHDDDD